MFIAYTYIRINVLLFVNSYTLEKNIQVRIVLCSFVTKITKGKKKYGLQINFPDRRPEWLGLLTTLLSGKILLYIGDIMYRTFEDFVPNVNNEYRSIRGSYLKLVLLNKFPTYILVYTIYIYIIFRYILTICKTITTIFQTIYN